jgi:hypothetical protein
MSFLSQVSCWESTRTRLMSKICSRFYLRWWRMLRGNQKDRVEEVYNFRESGQGGLNGETTVTTGGSAREQSQCLGKEHLRRGQHRQRS